MFQEFISRLTEAYASEGEVYEVDENCGVKVITLEELQDYEVITESDKVEGLYPEVIFDGGVMLWDDHLTWFIFDEDKPSITMEQAKALSTIYGAGGYECLTEPNPKDCLTWAWQDEQLRY